MALLRSIATVGGWTMASRVLGLVRDMLIARGLGTGPEAEAFFVAFRLPNMFRRLFAEGAFNAAFVPMFARRLEEEGQESARRFAEQVAAVMLTGLLGLTILAQITMPWLLVLLAGGFLAKDQPDKYALAVQFSIITFPYLLFMSLTALQGGILNSLHRFAHAAAAPILLNIVAIVALAVVAPLTGLPAHTLVWAVAVAGVCQFLWLVIACHRAGIALRLPVPRLDPAVRRLFRLMGPGLLGAGVMQINGLVGTQIASWQDGAISYLSYADRLYQLPLSLIGVAIGVVLLPELTRHLRGGRGTDAMITHNRCLELALLLSVPAAVALVVIPQPIVAVLFEGGRFGPEDTRAVAFALAAFAVGLPAYVLIKALAPGFYAREDTKTPFNVAIVDVSANILLSLSLFPWIGFLGIAIATAVAAWINAGLLFCLLRRRDCLTIDRQLRRRVPRIVLSSLLMGAAVWGLSQLLQPWLAREIAVQVLALAALVLAGLAVFGAACLLTGAASLAEVRATIRRQRRPSSA
jgi:putative peptidoglycan lipid II flippase